MRYIIIGALAGLVVLWLLAAPWYTTVLGALAVAYALAASASAVERRRQLKVTPRRIKPW